MGGLHQIMDGGLEVGGRRCSAFHWDRDMEAEGCKVAERRAEWLMSLVFLWEDGDYRCQLYVELVGWRQGGKW